MFQNNSQINIEALKYWIHSKSAFASLEWAKREGFTKKISYIFTGQNIDESYLDDRKKRVKISHPNAAGLNQLILKKLSEANDKLLESEYLKSHQSVSLVKRSNKILATFLKLQKNI